MNSLVNWIDSNKLRATFILTGLFAVLFGLVLILLIWVPLLVATVALLTCLFVLARAIIYGILEDDEY